MTNQLEQTYYNRKVRERQTGENALETCQFL